MAREITLRIHGSQRPLAFETLEPRCLLSASSLEGLEGGEWFTAAKDDPLFVAVGGDLAKLHAEYSESIGDGRVSDHIGMRLPGGISPDLQFRGADDQYVVIDAVARVDAPSLQADLESIGLLHGENFGRFVSGWLPIESIDEMAAMDSLAFASPAYKPISNVGLVTSQGDIAQASDVARFNFGVLGTGQTVGVISDTFANSAMPTTTTAAQDVANGDLPGPSNPNGFTTPVNNLSEGSPGKDEGRAMMQIVHDVAPGAEIAFHTGFNGMADFANGILELSSQAGATVIVDDLILFAEPMFQDGIIAQAADQVAGAGVPYFSSAGNSARQSYQAPFRPSGIFNLVLGQFHDFDPGPSVDALQNFTLPIGSSLTISFQWDSPFFSVSGGGGSPNDMDIFITNIQGTSVLAESRDANQGGDAVEILQFTNDGSLFTDQFAIAITSFSGLFPNLIKAVELEGAMQLNEYATFSPASWGHANAAGAESVAASFYQKTPAFGVNPPLPEGFTSLAGIPILYDTSGNSVFDLRPKPEITAPDGANNSFFGGGDPEGDGFPNFFGTSAAAPHAAAVAALMLEVNGTLSPAEVYAALEQTAIDMDNPFTFGFDSGFDFLTGYGLIQADLALAAVDDGGGNTAPVVTGLPNVTLNENETLNNAIDPYSYTSDAETPDEDLTYSIVGNTNPDVGVSIDALDFIDIAPAADWNGISDVTLRVTDPEGLWAEDTFRITVVETSFTPGDFDNDGDVDGDDFLIWQAGFNVDDSGDADGDGDTDGDDFLIWQTNFGSADGSGSSLAAAPAEKWWLESEILDESRAASFPRAIADAAPLVDPRFFLFENDYRLSGRRIEEPLRLLSRDPDKDSTSRQSSDTRERAFEQMVTSDLNWARFSV